MEQITIKINWKGPFSINDVDSLDDENGLYLFAGKGKRQRKKEILYCGITEGKYVNRFNNHHKLSEISKELEIWLGKIEYPLVNTRTHLETAESIVIYFWQPRLNDRKRYHPPRPTTVISHWFKKNGDPRFNQLGIYKELHDVLCWDGDYWRTGNLIVYADS